MSYEYMNKNIKCQLTSSLTNLQNVSGYFDWLGLLPNKNIEFKQKKNK